MKIKNKTGYLATLYLMFLALLFISGSFAGVISELVYILAFALPASVGVLVIYRDKKENTADFLRLPSRERFNLFLPTVIPTIFLVLLISMITSVVMYVLFGATSRVELGDNIFLAMIMHALLPAVLEEMLFRYIPLCLYDRGEGMEALVVSSLFFALVHNDFFVIPYAFIAGMIFMTVDLVCGSVWPSVILHFLNNALSVLLIFYSANSVFVYVFYVLLILLSVVSLRLIARKGKIYREKIKSVLSGDKLRLTKEILYLAVPTLIMAAADLISKI